MQTIIDIFLALGFGTTVVVSGVLVVGWVVGTVLGLLAPKRSHPFGWWS